MIAKQFAASSPFSLVCLPLMKRATIALKNTRARLLHCIFDSKVASPYHTVTINLG
jgi:hypothetical protein